MEARSPGDGFRGKSPLMFSSCRHPGIEYRNPGAEDGCTPVTFFARHPCSLNPGDPCRDELMIALRAIDQFICMPCCKPAGGQFSSFMPSDKPRAPSTSLI